MNGENKPLTHLREAVGKNAVNRTKDFFGKVEYDDEGFYWLNNAREKKEDGRIMSGQELAIETVFYEVGKNGSLKKQPSFLNKSSL